MWSDVGALLQQLAHRLDCDFSPQSSWMGLDMRLVRYFHGVLPAAIVGAGFICQAAMPLAARSWDNPAIEINDESAARPQNNGSVVDPAVKQAAYYDSRPRPNATTIDS